MGPQNHIEVIPATPDQEPVLANLMELYAHDFSEFLDIELGPQGRFGYQNLPLYWSEPGRHPFLVRLDGQLAGFVLVKRGSEIAPDEAVWDMAEFFVVRRYRRRGMGTRIAHEVWRRFPGRWQVRVMEANAAHQFWERAIGRFTAEPIDAARLERNGKWWRVFAFESRPVE